MAGAIGMDVVAYDPYLSGEDWQSLGLRDVNFGELLTTSDFITLHWYGGDFTTTSAVSELRGYIQAVYDRYHLPIWLTEFALTDFSGSSPRFPAPAPERRPYPWPLV